MTHTKGPWRINEGDRIYAGDYSKHTQVHICNIFTPNPVGPIASTFNSSDYKNELRANANLIAAAPELLESLEMILESILNPVENTRLSVDTLIKIKNVIKKAKGE